MDTLDNVIAAESAATHDYADGEVDSPTPRDQSGKMIEPTADRIEDATALQKPRVQMKHAQYSETGATDSRPAAKDDEAREMEAMRQSTDPVIKALLRKIDVLSVREAAAREELDTVCRRETANDQRAQAIKRCQEAQLPEYAITDIFVDDLVKSDPATQDKLIADRKQLSTQSKGKPTMSIAREAVEKVAPSGKPADSPSVDEFVKEVRSLRSW